MKEVREQLHPVDQPRPGARERGGGVDGDYLIGAECAQVIRLLARLCRRLGGVEAARHHDDDLGRAAVLTSSQPTTRDLRPGSPSTSSPPASATISGTQCPPA